MFKNEPLTDFTVLSNHSPLIEALSKIESERSENRLVSVPIILGEKINTNKSYTREDPSDTNVTIGTVHRAGAKEVEDALKSLKNGFQKWAQTDYRKRADILRQVASIMRDRKSYLSALIIREAGKPWKEADADVAEAIDFCDYYADEMCRLGPPQKMGDHIGELNHYFYQPRGIAVVISPWNFPLAIACGMTVAALVTGNATILKPAEQTSIIAYKFAEILLEAGIPKDAFAFLPGYGEEIGRLLVESIDTQMICFTGSKQVGLEIINKASVLKPSQIHIKKVVAELGGKNCIIVDEDADLDEAIKGIIYSAFGFSGQKCSACSRVLGVGTAYEELLSRLEAATKDVIIGPASDPSSLVGPVIDKESCERIKATIEEGKAQLNTLYAGTPPDSGHFVAPTIFRDVSFDSPIWTEEIFGPVVAVAPAKSFEEAISHANGVQYALTGGVFSRSPKNLSYARQNFGVGNLYINRGCTGALVYRQPFGGFKLSGVGSKAGGPDYLIQFMEPRTITENTMRKGFSPE